MTPLGSDTTLPAIQDLTEFWRDCEQVLETVDPEVELGQLQSRAIRGLGPLLLGKAAWKIVEAESPESWRAFRQEVENEFGLPG